MFFLKHGVYQEVCSYVERFAQTFHPEILSRFVIPVIFDALLFQNRRACQKSKTLSV